MDSSKQLNLRSDLISDQISRGSLYPPPHSSLGSSRRLIHVSALVLRMSNLQDSVLQAVAGATQDFTPTKQICAFLNAFHSYDHDKSRSVEANHYCSHQSPTLRQCLIYDSSSKDAKLIGVEYMIPISRFETLPDEEKRLWHSHVYEVKSGLLQMPKPTGIPSTVWDAAETKEMENIIGWMGKYVHLSR